MKCIFVLLAFLLTTCSAFAQSHVGDCTKKDAVEKCGPLKGEAHFVCDREFLLANPLSCKPFTGKAGAECEAELKAFQTCEPKQSREFMKCVKETTGISPMGH
jgi:hypothetical protein